jgi:hypothetical protein
MSIDIIKKQVDDQLNTFRKAEDLKALRKAGDLIGQIEVHGLPVYEERRYARTAKLELWLALLDAIDSTKDPAFDPADLPASKISIPPETPMKPDHMIVTPEGIADPVERERYNEAVAANAAKTTRYCEQKELRQLDMVLSARAQDYIRTVLLKSPQSVKEMNHAIAIHIHDAGRSEYLRSLVVPRQQSNSAKP